MAEAPYKEIPGMPGVKVATYRTPTCDAHLPNEQGDGHQLSECPYCALQALVDEVDARNHSETSLRKAVQRARRILRKRRHG